LISPQRQKTKRISLKRIKYSKEKWKSSISQNNGNNQISPNGMINNTARIAKLKP